MSGTPKATTDEIEQRIREERQAVKAEREPIELPSEDELEQYLGQRLPELEQRGVPVEHE